MVSLTKTRTILYRNAPGPDGHTYRPADDGEQWSRTTSVTLDPDVFADMGSPDTITVTIEPGDLLNVEELDGTA